MKASVLPGVLCLALVALSEVGLGLVYLTAKTPMSYHLAAAGSDWAEMEPGMRWLLRTLLNGYGSTHLAVGLAMLLLIAIPLRRGEVWARWALLATGFPVVAATAFLSHRLATMTGAGVPWKGAVGLLAIFVLGLLLVSVGRSKD